MKKILFLAAGLLILFTSCRYSDCDDPYVAIHFELDSSAKLIYQFDTYKKGSKFSELLNSKQDSAYIEFYPDAKYEKGTFLSVDDKHDYMITVLSTGKIYKISDITYSGKKRVRADGIISENRTRCTRSLSYTMNGQTYDVEGKTYEYGYGEPNGAVVTISK